MFWRVLPNSWHRCIGHVYTWMRWYRGPLTSRSGKKTLQPSYSLFISCGPCCWDHTRGWGTSGASSLITGPCLQRLRPAVLNLETQSLYYMNLKCKAGMRRAGKTPGEKRQAPGLSHMFSFGSQSDFWTSHPNPSLGLHPLLPHPFFHLLSGA